MKYDGKRQRLNAIFKQIEKDMHEGVFHKVIILHDKDDMLRVYVQSDYFATGDPDRNLVPIH